MNYYKKGSWNVICDSCGFKYKSHQVKQRWDGYIVCDACYETRHPMDFIRAKADKQYVPFSRPRGTDLETSVTYLLDASSCTVQGKTGIAGYMVAGCATPSKYM